MGTLAPVACACVQIDRHCSCGTRHRRVRTSVLHCMPCLCRLRDCALSGCFVDCQSIFDATKHNRTCSDASAICTHHRHLCSICRVTYRECRGCLHNNRRTIKRRPLRYTCVRRADANNTPRASPHLLVWLSCKALELTWLRRERYRGTSRASGKQAGKQRDSGYPKRYSLQPESAGCLCLQ